MPSLLPVLPALLLPVLLCRAAVDTAVHTHGDLANRLLGGFHIVGVSCIGAHGLHTNVTNLISISAHRCEAPSAHNMLRRHPFLHSR